MSPDFIGAKDDRGGGDNWSYKQCKAPVKSSSLTNQHSVFASWKPFLSPKQQCDSSEGKILLLHIKICYHKMVVKLFIST